MSDDAVPKLAVSEANQCEFRDPNGWRCQWEKGHGGPFHMCDDFRRSSARVWGEPAAREQS